MKSIHYLFFLCAIVMITGCRIINSSLMFNTDKSFKFDSIPPKAKIPEYKLAPNDFISFHIYTNDGFKLIDLTTFELGDRVTLGTSLQYLIDLEGYVKLPILGRVKIEGKSVRETEIFLEEQYSKYYNKPFILVTVANKRVYVFPGAASAAKIIPLVNINTTLIEALTQAGGLAVTGKAYKVKIIRGDLEKPQVFCVDLSTIEGTRYAGMVLQNNDIIYVEPRAQIAKNIIAEAAPYVSLVASVLLVLRVLNLAKNI